jgi:hypothetical protein
MPRQVGRCGPSTRAKGDERRLAAVAGGVHGPQIGRLIPGSALGPRLPMVEFPYLARVDGPAAPLARGGREAAKANSRFFHSWHQSLRLGTCDHEVDAVEVRLDPQTVDGERVSEVSQASPARLAAARRSGSAGARGTGLGKHRGGGSEALSGPYRSVPPGA